MSTRSGGSSKNIAQGNAHDSLMEVEKCIAQKSSSVLNDSFLEIFENSLIIKLLTKSSV